MSQLIVEVCRVDKVEVHPNADRMKLATVKGWQVCIAYDPETGKSQFEEGEKCVYFPPDSIMKPELCNSPDDVVPGRLNVARYLKALPKDIYGNAPPEKRVAATSLRGQVSYGVIMKLDPAYGDDPDWDVGTDVMDHYGITKYEPPLPRSDGDQEKDNYRFYRYSSVEHWNNYPDVIQNGDEVVITEKVHGRNTRIGLILEDDDTGIADYTLAVGSHSTRKKEFVDIYKQYDMEDYDVLAGGITPETGHIIKDYNKLWKVVGIRHVGDEGYKGEKDRVSCILINEEGEPIKKLCTYWKPLHTHPQIKDLLNHINDLPYHENKHSIVVYGELFGKEMQDMEYGLKGISFIGMDISINDKYLDWDTKIDLFKKFDIPVANILYRGPFHKGIIKEYTSGYTTMCDPTQAGRFKGREGIVIHPVKELYYNNLNKRAIFKSISADYYSRKGETTEFH